MPTKRPPASKKPDPSDPAGLRRAFIFLSAATLPLLVFGVGSGGGLTVPIGFVLLVTLIRVAGAPLVQRFPLRDSPTGV